MSGDPFNDFLEEVNKYPSMWDSLELTAVGATKGQGLYLLGLSCTLSWGLHSSHEVLFETPDVVILKEAKPFSELSGVLDTLRRGTFSLANRLFVVEGFNRFECKVSGARQGWVDTPYPYILLFSVGRSVREVVDESSVERKLQQWGYRSLWDLTQEKIGFQVGGSYISQIRFVAPIFVQGDVTFVADNVRLVLRYSRSLRTEDLSASFEAPPDLLRGIRAEGGKLDFRDAVREENDVSFTLVKEWALSPQADSVMVWLFHTSRSEPLCTLRAVKPATPESNPVWAATQLVLSRRRADGQMLSAEEILRESLGLGDKVRDSGRFETAVHNLMACLGYKCIFTGREWGAQGIDTLAFDLELASVLAVSVTISNNIGDKIRTMLPKLEELRAELKGLSVLPVVVAAVSPNVVLHSDRQEANAHGIKLILKPELEQSLNALSTSSLSKARSQWDSILGRG